MRNAAILVFLVGSLWRLNGFFWQLVLWPDGKCTDWPNVYFGYLMGATNFKYDFDGWLFWFAFHLVLFVSGLTAIFLRKNSAKSPLQSAPEFEASPSSLAFGDEERDSSVMPGCSGADTAEPNPECPVYGFDDCPCRKRSMPCLFDMRELSEEQQIRTLKLAEKFGWQSH